MIRIDLGKDELEKKGKGDLFGKLGLGGGAKGDIVGQLRSVFSDAKALVMTIAVVLVALFPHLFYGQYRAYLTDQHNLRIKELKEKTELVNAEIEKFKPFQTELESYEQQKKLVNDRILVVNELLQARGTPVSVLDALGQSIPARLWLARIDVGLTAENLSLKVEGNAYSNEEVSDFLDRFAESIHVGDVTLEQVEVAKIGNIEVKNFRLKAVPKMKFPARRVATQAPGDPNAPPPAAAPADGSNTPPPGQNAPPAGYGAAPKIPGGI